MIRPILLPTIAALACTVSTAALAQTAPRIFYIDFAAGNDANDGLAPTRAWKRAPGDPLATGRVAPLRLQPGDVLRFRGGVRYHGTIRVRDAGTPDRPIVYDGSGWGTTRAVIDGSDPLPAGTPCTSAAACGGAANWRSLVRIPIPATMHWHNWLFADDRPMVLAQFPPVASAMHHEEATRYATVPIARLAEFRAGFIPAPTRPANLERGTPVLALWHAGNDITYRDAPRFSTAGINFDVGSFVPAANREGRWAVMNSPAMIDAPGKFAIDTAADVAIVWPTRAGQRFAIGAHRNGFQMMGGPSNVTIRGFAFTNASAPPDAFAIGNAVFGNAATSGLNVSHNVVRSSVLMGGDGVISVHRLSNSSVNHNDIAQSPFSSAIRTSQSPGPLQINCNRIDDIGRSGIVMLSVRVGQVRGNHLTRILGLHGNAITAYLDNRQIDISDNVVTQALRPLTMHGFGSTPFFQDNLPTSISIARNTFIGTDPQEGAITSWGKGLTNVSINNNFLAAPRNAIRLLGTETNISANGNQLVGPTLVHNGANILTGTNTTFSVTGNGATLVQTASQQTPAASVCGT